MATVANTKDANPDISYTALVSRVETVAHQHVRLFVPALPLPVKQQRAPAGAAGAGGLETSYLERLVGAVREVIKRCIDINQDGVITMV